MKIFSFEKYFQQAKNILNRHLRDILNRHLRNILTWGEEAFTLSPLQQHFLSLVSSGLLRSQLTFWLSLLETTGLRRPIISYLDQPCKLNWIFHPYCCSSLKLQLNQCKFNWKELNRLIFQIIFPITLLVSHMQPVRICLPPSSSSKEAHDWEHHRVSGLLLSLNMVWLSPPSTPFPCRLPCLWVTLLVSWPADASLPPFTSHIHGFTPRWRETQRNAT